jgi:guanylate kinase
VNADTKLHGKKYKIIALFGKSASGKDTIQKWIVSHYPTITKGIVSCTTRPPREGEVDTVDYHFLSNELFAEKVLEGSMLEATSFRDWFYGTSIEELHPDKVNIGVFNIDGIECLLEDPRLQVIPVLVHATNKTRLLRSLNRESSPDCAEICRRFFADEDDFIDIDFDYWGWMNEKEEHTTTYFRHEQLMNILNEFSPVDKIN